MTARRRLSALAALLLAGSVLAGPVVAQQPQPPAYAYVTANLNQRAGPATRYPSLGVVPARTQVRINGCLEDLSWCEGAVGDVRGWMSADYLRLYDYRRQAWVEVDDYAGTSVLPRYAFNLDRYWTAMYPDRPFYAQRAAWAGVPPRAPGIDTGVFYRELSPYGRWVALDGQYVFMPAVERGWRPYTDGRWEYTQRYGWTWVSNEPFGWATYHYGRWAYSDRLGWVWQPGTQWAPAWVAWRGSEDHLAWAPLPPDAGPGFRPGAGYDEIPSYYWQVVPSQEFLSPNLREVVVRGDDGGRRGWLDAALPLGIAALAGNLVVNDSVKPDYVERKTRQRVVPREIVITNDERSRGAGQPVAADAAVRVYQPPAAEAPAVSTPPAVLPAEIAARAAPTAGQAGDEPATDTRLADTPPPEEAAAPPTEAPPLAPEEAAAPEQPAPEQPASPPADVAPPAPAPEEQPAPPPPVAEEPAPPPADAAPPAPAPEQPAPPPPPVAEEPAPPPADAVPPAPAPEHPAPPPPPPPPPAEVAPAPDPAPPPPAVEAPAPPEEAPPPPEPEAASPAPAEVAPPPPEPAPPPPVVEEPPPPPQEAPPAPPEEPPPPPADAAPPPAPEPVPPAPSPECPDGICP